MPNSLSSTGLVTSTQQELITAYTTAMQQIYGPDINLNSNTPDGQLINLFIQSVLDVQDLLTQIYNSFDPDLAIGNILDQRVAINGIKRQGGTYTVVNITLTTNQSVNLYGLDQSIQPIYTVADNIGNQWQLISTILGLTAGTHVLAFQAQNPGNNNPVPNSITIPVTIVLGVLSINNPTAPTSLGINEESDSQLRLRRQASVSNSSQGYLQGLLGTLENINGITSAFVYENLGSSIDTNGVPGHSIWVIVAGVPSIPVATAWSAATTYSYGQLASSAGVNYISWQNNNTNNAVTNTVFWGVYNPVVQAIYAKRNAGCGMKGSTAYTITQVDGTSFIVYYDTVTEVPLFIKFQANSLDGVNAPNIAGIRAGLVSSFVPAVFQEVNINALSTAVQAIDSNTLVINSGFSLAEAGPYTVTLQPAAKNLQFQVSAANIVILPMILNATGATATILSGVVTQMNISVSHGNTIQFTGLGGYGALTYSMQSGAGSVNAATGLYTSVSVGTDVVQVADSDGHTAIAVVTVT